MASKRNQECSLLYQVNTRVWLNDLAGEMGRPATLDDIPDAALDRIAALGFKWVWLLGVWRLGERGRQISRARNDWRAEFKHILPDLTDQDISGSCFAITGYTVGPTLGGTAALGRLRRRLRARNLRLILDFVPNHTALDHPWIKDRPDFYVTGTDADLAREPHNYCRVDTRDGPRVIAHGRDPYFPGWPDTAQLNYGEVAVQEAMRQELANVAGICDGVRCDMAMLMLPEVYRRTWNIEIEPFWPEAIRRIRLDQPDFVFIAEVYWDLEWTLLQQDFDYTYDKRLYDRLRGQNALSVKEHLAADQDFQRRQVRFLENHDEPRAAAAFPPSVHEAAAVLTYLSPGLRFFHQGQMEGRKTHIPMHLCRAPAEAIDTAVRNFYQRLLRVLRLPIVRSGDWTLLTPAPTDQAPTDQAPTDQAPTDQKDDDAESDREIIACVWSLEKRNRVLVIVNYTPEPVSSHLKLPFPDLRRQKVRLRDLMGSTKSEESGDALLKAGLAIDLPPWGYRVLELSVMAS